MAPGADPVEVVSGSGPAVQLGKRYTDASGSLEVLCTKAGAGPLALDGVLLEIKAAAQLPASD
ncbi:MAG: hypothetical protein OJJ54_07120 [Pseudonocardia sp.]|nr:hypothetical protein [Pseudonocardia sp.]